MSNDIKWIMPSMREIMPIGRENDIKWNIPSGRGMVSNELYLQGRKTISNESCFKGEKWYQINYAFEVKKML